MARRRTGGRVDATFEFVFPDGPLSSMTLLMVAMAHGREGLAEALLQRGADVSLQSSNGDTALSLAAFYGFVKLVELALRHGAEINRQSGSVYSTALMDAAWEGHVEVIDSLIRHGAAIDHQCHNGDTALILAAFRGHPAALWGRSTFRAQGGNISFIYFSHISPRIWGYFSKFLRSLNSCGSQSQVLSTSFWRGLHFPRCHRPKSRFLPVMAVVLERERDFY